MEFIICFLLAALFTGGRIVTDTVHAIKGTTPPHVEKARLRAGRRPPPRGRSPHADGKPRMRDVAAVYWGDAMQDAIDWHNRRRAERESGPQPDPVGPAVPEPLADPGPAPAPAPTPTPGPAPAPAAPKPDPTPDPTPPNTPSDPTPDPASGTKPATTTEGDPMTDTTTPAAGGTATGDAHDLETASQQCDLLDDDLTRIDTSLDVIDEAITSASNATELIEAFLRSKNMPDTAVGGMSVARDMLSPTHIKALIDAIAAAKQGVRATKEAIDSMHDEATEALQGADGSVVNGR